MTEIQDKEPEVTASTMSTGTILSQAREAKGITVNDLADQIRVPVSVIEAIEKDRVPKNLPETFVRGYIRSYAKKVGVEESLVLTTVKTTAAFEVPEMSEQEMQSFSKRTKKQAFERRLKLVSWIIVFVLVVALVIWWYQDSNNTDTAPLAGGEESNLTPVATETASQPIEPLEPQSAFDADAQDTIADQDTPAQLEETVASATDEGADLSDTAIATDDAAEQSVPVATDVVDQSAPIELTADQKALLADVGEVDEEGFMNVEMLFDKDCWVEVYDINEERIAVGNKPAGYKMKLNAQGPFSVLLGNPDGVSIWVEGQPFDMTQFPGNRVARFEIDAADLATN